MKSFTLLALLPVLVATQAHGQPVKVKGGGKVGTILGETRFVAQDNPQHVITLARRSEPNHGSSPDCATMQVDVIAYSDTIAGTGMNRGHRTSTCPNGDKQFATYQGTTTAVPKQGGPPEVTLEGTWQYTGGTGKYAGIRGNGTYKGRLTPEGVVYEWEGEQILKQ